MAIVETLEVRFQADMSALSAQLRQLSGQIAGLGAVLGEGKTGLAANAGELIRAVAAGLRDGAAALSAPEEAAAAITNRFILALSGGAAGVAPAARAVAAAARFDDSGAQAAARSAGVNLSQGFAQGISSSYGAVMKAANRIAAAAVSRIRSALSIHSPSRVSFELGGYFGQGFADGVSASIRMAEQSAASLSAASSSALAAVRRPEMEAGGLGSMVQQAVSGALGDVNLVVPLHVDGVKLGEASIRGINQVTRSAGRLMLEI